MSHHTQGASESRTHKSRKRCKPSPPPVTTPFEEVMEPRYSYGGLRGLWLHMAATDDEILQHGIVGSADLPKDCYRSIKRIGEDLRLTRRADGRCNVQTFGIQSARLDLKFRDFMHGLLADKQLSLVSKLKGDDL